MRQKMIQACTAGLLALISISTQAHSEEIKNWVKEDQQAEHGNYDSLMYKITPAALAVGSAGVTARQFSKADLLRKQARESAHHGNRLAASRLEKQAERAESLAAGTVMLSVPAAVVAITRSFAVKDKLSKLVDEKVSQQVKKASATPVIFNGTSNSARTLTSNEAAD